ncbi:MAG: hypothetical protein C0505_03645 [Leptothrix sp. (in: Bacteria)]|nr:hypothetical protein [Leptothrix sp. (in: b-proteobacteria)]
MTGAPVRAVRLLPGVFACLAALGAAALAAHHPLSPLLALTACIAMGVFAFALPAAWPLLVLPLMPLIGLMPWSGWLLVEELDLLVLAAAAGGYARWAWRKPQAEAQAHRHAPWAWFWLLPLLAVTGVALLRGLADATPAPWHWWHGYRDPLNSLRLAKPVLATLLMLPLVLQHFRRQPQASTRAFALGMAGLLATVAWGVFWERWANTGLLNFSTDYRAVGLFWEMHVGGAALDAALAMGLPFGVAALAAARTPRAWALAAGVVALGAYAALTTFSRVVYLAAPMAVALWWGLDRRRLGQRMGSAGLRAGLVAGVVTSGLAAWLFSTGGYRSMLALMGALALLLPMASVARRLPPRPWLFGLLGIVAGSALAAGSLVLNKGPYLLYVAAWLATVAAGWRARHRPSPSGAFMLAGFGVLLPAMVVVGVGWHGTAAAPAGFASAVVLALTLVAACARQRPLWPENWRWQATWLAVMAMGAVVIGVFGGGAYMSERFTTSSGDTRVRQDHVYKTLSWLSAEDWWLGKGLGRFVDNYALSGKIEDQVGDYRLVAAGGRGGGQALVITSGKHVLGWGEIFRVSQRVAVPAPGPLEVRLDVRAVQALVVHVDICEKHLLYTGNCRTREIGIKATEGRWQPVTLTLEPHNLSRGSWWAPRFIVFSVALGSSGHRMEVDQISLRDGAGNQLLTNGGFEDGMARWFFSSDRHHMPWHAKNMAVHVLFEQGLLGLAAWTLALAAAMWRVTAGAASRHPLAPSLASALLGVLVVGLVDSILDMPRIGWLMLTLMVVALALPRNPRV